MDIQLTISLADGTAQAHSVPVGVRVLPIIVVQRAGKFAIFLNSCPHAGVRLDSRDGGFFDHSGSYLQCSLHGALFDPQSGRCVSGPCQGARLIPIAHRVAADGSLIIRDVEHIPARAMPGPRRY